MSARPPSCRHCGSALVGARALETGFCCTGCAYVHRLVHERGLGSYYTIKDAITAPADPAVFQQGDHAWLAEAQGAEETRAAAAGAAGDRPGSVPTLLLGVQGISCAGCVWLIERLFGQEAGARDIVVVPQSGSMRLRWIPGAFDAAGFAGRLQAFGYLTGPSPAAAEPDSGGEGRTGDAGGRRSASCASRGLVMRTGLCAAFAMNVMLFTLPVYFGMELNAEYAALFRLLSMAFATLSLLVGGTYFIGRAAGALRLRVLHIDLPIAVGIIGAYGGSLYGWLSGDGRTVYFDFVSMFILLMLVGRWAQESAVEGNRRRLLARQPAAPRVRLEGGGTCRPEEVEAGARLVVSPGQTVPVTARLGEGGGLVSLASINGEPDPVAMAAGRRVPGGAVNVGRGDLHAEAVEGWRGSLLERLLQPGDRAGFRHVFLERVVRWYLVGIFAVAIAAGIGWWLATRDGARTWSVVTAVLVVSCPCAVGLAFPLADEMASTALRQRGVFVRENDLWGRLHAVRRIAFDKTGTLTLESPELLNPEAIAGLGGEGRAALLALVSDSPHPVSQGLLEALLAGGAGAADPGLPAVTEVVGSGLEAGGWSLGRAGWRAPGAAGETILARDGVPLAAFRMGDSIRVDARAEVAALERRGLRVHILSGDDPGRVRRIATELGLAPERALGGLSPEAKAAWFAGGGRPDALMLGDGANDSLAFDGALCCGTPVIHRGVLSGKADFYYLGRGIGGIRALFEVDRVRRRAQGLILLFSVGYNIMAVGRAAAGQMSPLVAAILMPASSLATLAIVTAAMRQARSPAARQDMTSPRQARQSTPARSGAYSSAHTPLESPTSP